MSMNIPPIKEEGYFAYSLRVGEMLCLLVTIILLLLLQSRHKSLLPLMPRDNICLLLYNG